MKRSRSSLSRNRVMRSMMKKYGRVSGGEELSSTQASAKTKTTFSVAFRGLLARRTSR